MSFLDTYSNDIHKLCTDHKVKSLYAFGSVLTDQFSQTSDIDLIVDFHRIDVINYADNYFNLKFSRHSILTLPIDHLNTTKIKTP